ncbi:MAG: Uncharacterized MFS-type transporter [uncultured Thermomicrobiales bacterium]|uniref:Uncharacterized MFS-type transporter n=1 Tax=uncultured Thermomicrobiales bacterium TaxID=1645740 RepID=A0A6J4UR89_9BACT|nr:MAG: Uncharacterized MFS-type transporter [uncultured Thermomicrobiales bacterium]
MPDPTHAARGDAAHHADGQDRGPGSGPGRDDAYGADPAAPTGEDTPAPRRSVVGWVLYDLANTIFSLNIVSFYFSLWVVNDKGGRDGDYLIANSASMALMFLTAPLLGALSDQVPRRLPLLVVTTLACCGFTALLGLGGLRVSLVLFAAANYFFQAGLIFYDALLPSVSTPETRGRIGGIGVAVGYLGSLIGLGAGAVVLAADEDAKPTVFRLTALLFLLFALPCFLFVRERPRPDATAFNGAAVRRALGALRSTAQRARRVPGLPRFLVGHVFYADAANTLIATMGIYATKEIGFTEGQARLVLLVGILGAIGGGLVWGRTVDRIGPRRTLARVLALWATVLVATAGVAYFDLPQGVFWAVAPVAGVALGGTWAADRPLMLALTPPRYLGQLWGLYAMVGRFAAILGPLLWTGIVDGLQLGRPAAVLSLLVLIGLAYLAIRPVDDGRGEVGRRAADQPEAGSMPTAAAGSLSS